MESQTFDLLPNGRKNALFRVSFDFYTPRAHFILLPKSDKTIEPEFSRMTSEQACELIEAAKTMLSSSGANCGTLSIHRGSWTSKKDTFLAHLCVDVESYLDLFRRRKGEIPNWPSSGYVTKQWKADKDPCSYAKNVRGYPYRSYLDEDVAQITNTQLLVHDLAHNSRKNATKHSGINVVYHSSHPKIGFLGNGVRNTEYLKEVLLVMEKYAKEHGLTACASRNENNGCHLCLYLGSSMLCSYFGETQEWCLSGVDVASAYNVVGYTVTTGAQFYNLCLPKQRQCWFKAFKSSRVVRKVLPRRLIFKLLRGEFFLCYVTCAQN